MNSTCMQQQEGILETTLNGKERIPKDFSQYIILIKLKKRQSERNITSVFMHWGLNRNEKSKTW